ncbi:MAG: S-methyl-5-thioribose kinase [Sulfurimonas sp.]|uniref:S-methyl-5-thioribose kinase n=1 Tax=Sulfurimonas sp. TaxID=2022749 RepID=UPI002623182A|nr:S-methyl-5-thioribose kinase [Sulfurimonas sp.]MDD2652865.1 S-methyl-5-thioribose kinase [Sulfurimonas sp.]MDD3452311.1 S-methyl-5-thioribose kinase [Sulfurimonas sp.]
MDYKELNKTTVLEYVANVDSVADYFATDELEVVEVGDGNLNYVYKIASLNDSKKALILKQAVPYLRCVGEEFLLSRDRMRFEIRALQKFYSIFPSFVPKVYHANEDMSLVVMEYLDEHIIMRKGLMEGVVYKNFSEHISTYMAATLFYTSLLHISSGEKRALVEKFNGNAELCKLTEDLVFSFPFMEHETNDNENVKENHDAQKLFLDMEFKERVLGLKYKFMTQSDALIHGDLHTGSIMINEKETYVIDPEFAFVGPFGFDIGALLANLANSYVHHSVVTKDEEYKTWLLQTIREVLEKFSEKFLSFWSESKNSALVVDGFLDGAALQKYKEKFVLNILRESVGFAGCKMGRRVYGVAGVAEIRGIKDSKLRRRAESMALSVAKAFVMGYDKIQNCDEVVEIIKNAG